MLWNCLVAACFLSLMFCVQRAGVKWLCISLGAMCVLMQLSWPRGPTSHGVAAAACSFPDTEARPALKCGSVNAELLTLPHLLCFT